MNKKALCEEINRLYTLAEEAESSLKSALDNIKSLVGGLEELPQDAKDIEDDEEESDD